MHLDMRREHEDADLREFCANRLSSLETLGRMGGGHANVQHDQLWTVLANQRHQLRGIGRQTDDLEARRFEQASDALAQEEVVVCDHHTEVSHGRRRHFATRVKPLGDLGRWPSAHAPAVARATYGRVGGEGNGHERTA